MIKMKIYYEFFEDQNLLIQKFLGDWSTEIYEKYIEVSLKTIDINKIEKILTDMRQVNLKPAADDEAKLIGIRNAIPNKHFINIYLVENPLTTAMSHIYQEKLMAAGLKYNYCSTMEQALKLLDLDIDVHEMEQRIKTIQHQY
jgi:hypothetical protein